MEGRSAGVESGDYRETRPEGGLSRLLAAAKRPEHRRQVGAHLQKTNDLNCSNRDQERCENQDPGQLAFLHPLISNAMSRCQHQGCVRPSLERLPAATSQPAEREIVGDCQKHQEEQGGAESGEIGKAKLRVLQPEWMKLSEKIHPHPSTKMNGQADRGVQDRQNTRPDTHIPTKVRADGIRLLPQDIPRSKPKRCREKDQTGIGSSHAQAVASIWRRRRSIYQKGD